ncbi:MAG: ABC transporter permease, partial [Methylocystaceae bacterium]
LVITVGILLVPAAMDRFGNKQTTTDSGAQVYIIDQRNLIADEMIKNPRLFEGYTLKQVKPSAMAATRKKVKAEGNSLLVVVNEKNGMPVLEYYIANLKSRARVDSITRTINAVYLTKELHSVNIPPETVARLVRDIPFSVNELGGGKEQQANGMVSSMLIMMVLFFAIYFYGYGVAMSIASEKTSRVMELLITSASPASIVLGKSCAMGLLGAIQLALLVGAAAVTYRLAFPPDLTISGISLNLASFTPEGIAVIFIYYLLGYALYAMLNAVVGATVSKAEDLNSALMPISMISMLAFYVSYFTVMSPDSMLARVISYIPFTAPFSVPGRFLSTTVSPMVLGLSLVILLVSVVLVSWLSIRLYSAAVLHYGERLKLKDLIRMSPN